MERIYEIVKPIERSEIRQKFDELEKTIEIYEHIWGVEDTWIKEQKENIKQNMRDINKGIIKMMQIKRPIMKE